MAEQSAPAVAMTVAVADGVRLHVRHWPAAPAGELPFLLVHGLSSNARLWDGVARALAAAGHPAYAIDLRSHGESDRPAEGYDTATAVADVAAAAAALDLTPVLVGQSWGGNVAVGVAARHPERVRALALVDGGWIDLQDRFGSWARCEKALRPAEMDGITAHELTRSLRRAHPDWAPWAVEATLANFHTDAAGRLSRRLPIPQHMRILRSMWDDPPAPLFAAVRAPTLLVPAGRGGSAQVSAAARAIGDATVRSYPGADHDLHAQHPDTLAADLLTLAAKPD